MVRHLPRCRTNQEPNPPNVDEAYECDICKCNFSRKDTLREHQQGIECITQMLNIAVKLVTNDVSGGQV
jgi:hypothetical protein